MLKRMEGNMSGAAVPPLGAAVVSDIVADRVRTMLGFVASAESAATPVTEGDDSRGGSATAFVRSTRRGGGRAESVDRRLTLGREGGAKLRGCASWLLTRVKRFGVLRGEAVEVFEAVVV